jgi:hypothetical protein
MQMAIEIVLSLLSGECLLCLTKKTGSDVAHVSLLQFVVLAAHLVDADVLECGDYGFYVETHGDEPIDKLLVVSVVSVTILARALSLTWNYVRCHLVLLLLLLRLDLLLPNRLCRCASTTLCNLLLGCVCVLVRPLACLVLELGGIPDEHTGNFGVLWVFGLRCAEEGLEGDEGGLDGQDWRPLRR